jgi:hypothetical protein
MAGGGSPGFHACWKAAKPSSNAWPSTTAMDQYTMFARLAPRSRDGREVAERLAGLLPDGGTDDLAVGVDAVLPADVDRLRWLFDHDGLAEGRVVVESFGVDVPRRHGSPSGDDDTSYGGFVGGTGSG